MPINAYAALEGNSPLEKFIFEPEPLRPYDVRIQITHCGVCHTDLDVLEHGWGGFPLVAGHEIVGTISATGDLVANRGVGQRVGVGWICESCLACEWCLSGQDNLCPDRKTTCIGRHGGFADSITVDSRFTFPIPDALSSADAAPLLCAGITVYAPLRRWNVSANMRVGVIGIGGLGHMGIKFASALGCEVTAFSTTPKKEAEARRFGATRFIVSSDSSQMKAAASSLDFIVCTTHVNLDWGAYLRTLRPNGTLCMVGALFEDLPIPAQRILSGQKSITGSLVGGRAMMLEMLDFAARHNITAQTEILPMSQVNSALEKVRNNEARYRVVLEVEG